MARTVVKGPLAFTVGSDQNLETYDSSFVLVTGSGAGTIIAQASTDKLTHAFGDTAAYVYRDGTPTYSGDQYAKAAISGVSNPGRYGVAVRVDAATGASADWYAMVVDTNSYPPNRETWIIKCVNNSASILSNVVDTWADGDTVELEAITNGANCDLKLYKNGTLLRTVTDSTSPLTGGKPGIYARSTSSYQMALDDLELGDVTTAPVLTSPTGTPTGNTTATAGFTTDQAVSGALPAYFLTLAAATAAPADAATLIANGATVSQTTGGTTPTRALTGLTTNTAVRTHMCQPGSNVVSSASYTPPTMASSGSLAAQSGTASTSFTWAGATPESQITVQGVGSSAWTLTNAGGSGLTTINSSTGVPGGTLTATPGVYTVTVTKTDSSTAGTNPTGGGAPPQTIVRTATLTVSAPGPTINTQPTAQTVSEGATATYTVSATSSGGALSYQWQRQAPGGGAFANVGTNSTSYTTAATVCATDHGAQVRVLVTDSNGTTQSSAVGLAVNATSSTSRPGADVTVSGWTASTGTDLFAMIDEISPGDSDYITSPGLTGSTAPATFALAYPLAAGNRVVGVRARTDTGTATLRVYLLNDAGTVMGTTADQAINSTFATYSLPVTLSGAATRARIEVVV